MIFLESTFDKLFTRTFPAQFPDWFRTIIANWAWLIIVGIIVVQPPINLGYWDAIYADRLPANLFSYGSVLVTISTMTLQFVAIPFLKDLRRAGWILLYISAFLILLYGVVRLFSTERSIGPLFGMTLLAAVFLYVLFQIRSRFK